MPSNINESGTQYRWKFDGEYSDPVTLLVVNPVQGIAINNVLESWKTIGNKLDPTEMTFICTYNDGST